MANLASIFANDDAPGDCEICTIVGAFHCQIAEVSAIKNVCAKKNS
jgi:hypothetical protein